MIKKVLKWGKQNIFLITIFIIIGFAFLSGLLALFHLRFRFFVYQVLVAVAFFSVLPAAIFFLGQTETTVYIDGVKYSAHTYEFLDRFVYYYDYKNFLISGNVLRMEDDYPGCIIGDPIRTVYDEYGNGAVIQGKGG